MKKYFLLYAPDADPHVQTSGGGAPPTTPPATNPAANGAAAAAPKTNPVLELVTKAKNHVEGVLRSARLAGIADMNVLGPLENAFEDARNAVTKNTAEKGLAEAAVKALKIAVNALANNSKTPPGHLSQAKEAVAALESALKS